MFTTLSIIDAKQENVKFKHKRQYLSEKFCYKNYTYYTTNLYTNKKNNQKSLNRFRKRAEMPIITDNCRLSERYKFITLANTVFSERSYRSIGIYDRTGKLPFLLPFLSQKSGFICIFTNNADAYTIPCRKIYYEYGTPSLITDRLSNISDSEIIFSTERPPVNTQCRFIIPENNTDIYVPDTLRINQNCNPFLVCAGLFHYGGFKEFGKVKLKSCSHITY